nr:PREDICTED: F-box only protein 6 [Lepisosteus oculatus]
MTERSGLLGVARFLFPLHSASPPQMPGHTGRRSRRRRPGQRSHNMGQSLRPPAASASSSEDLDTARVTWTALPVPVQEEVLLLLPAREVVCTCRRVCRLWRDLVDSASLWKRRCAREGLRPCDPACPPADWRVFYFLCRMRRNLLKNPRADDEFRGWTLVSNGGDKWAIEPVGTPLPDPAVQKYFVTSYYMCLKSQLIDLVEEGYRPALLDKVQPDIVVSDWCVSSSICVQLLSQRKQVLQEFRPKPVHFEQWNDMQWHQMRHVFRQYGRGVRFVKFTHGGKDCQFWAGWYGIRVTNSLVEIDPGAEEPAQPL